MSADTVGGQGLFDLSTRRPVDTDKIKYDTLGPYLGKKKFRKFEAAVKAADIKLDSIVFSRVVIEISQIDGQPYVEVSTDERCSLPIAGKQLPILQRIANEDNEISLVGLLDSINFIINDKRVFE